MVYIKGKENDLSDLGVLKERMEMCKIAQVCSCIG